MSNRNTWKWFAWGKHPGIADFICAGDPTPLFQSFTQWVDNGFSRISPQSPLRTRHRSWRFWTRGMAMEVVCGLVRNSSDSYGRSFPLLYLGAGELDQWPANCSLMPFAMESAWKGLEYVSAARYQDLDQLKDALQLIVPPEPTWHRYLQRVYDAPTLYNDVTFDEHREGQRRLFRIDCKSPENLPRTLVFCSNVLSRRPYESPMAVFIGETGGRITVAVMHATLQASDFTWLWSLGDKESHGAGIL
jgi:type VI secretion system ImpM family protein